MDTENNQAAETSNAQTGSEKEATAAFAQQEKAQNASDTATENAQAKKAPYKQFQTQEEFDNHAAGIVNSTRHKVEKELLSMLGLRADEKEKLAKFKKAYEDTLTDAQKKDEDLKTSKMEVDKLKGELAEKDGLIFALSKTIGKNAEEVSNCVKMARGLVDDNTTIEMAIDKVMGMIKTHKSVPTSQAVPDANSNSSQSEPNPFKTGNLTEQGKLWQSDREKARQMYQIAYGKYPDF